MPGRQRDGFTRNGEAAEWGEAGWIPLRKAHVKFHPENQNKELLMVMKNRASDSCC